MLGLIVDGPAGRVVFFFRSEEPARTILASKEDFFQAFLSERRTFKITRRPESLDTSVGNTQELTLSLENPHMAL